MTHTQTVPEPLAVLDELKRREPLFHRPEYGTTRQDFERMIDPAFREVGASGRRYDRAHVLDVLERRLHEPVEEDWKTADFRCLEIAADNYLLTYTLAQGERITRRATLWRRTADGWRVLYHQGTPAETP
jgi:hypothetical protein